MHTTVEWLSNNWPLVGALVAGTWAMIMWMKKQLLDNVFATKKEVQNLETTLGNRIDAYERANMERHLDFQEKQAARHSELKTLIIHHVGNKGSDH